MLGKYRKFIIIFGIIAVLIVVFMLASSSRNSNLQYSPKNTNVSAGPIVIKIVDEKIDPNSGTYSIMPSVSGNLQIVDNYIIFWPEQEGGFVTDSKYRAAFMNYKTVSGKSIKQVNLDFTISNNVDYEDLQKEVLDKYGHFEASFNPFLEKLPYKEDYRFNISFAINESLDHGHEDTDKSGGSGIVELLGTEDNWKEKKDNYIVYIETLVFQSPGQSYDAYVGEVRQARQDALNWITKQGVDVEKDIRYQFIPNDDTLRNPSSGREEVPTILGEDY